MLPQEEILMNIDAWKVACVVIGHRDKLFPEINWKLQIAELLRN